MFIKIIKKFILVLLFFPICLLGMEQHSWKEPDKLGNLVTFEWQKITGYTTFWDLWEKLAPTFAEAFADTEREFLLDPTTLHVKDEYAEVVRALPPENMWLPKIAIASANREARVECWMHGALEFIAKERAKLLMHPEEHSNLDTLFPIIARNEKLDILGFVVFVISPKDAALGSALLNVLAIVPSARRRGLAERLVRLILTLIPDIKHIHLETRVWNTGAKAFYKRLGFTEYARHDCGVELEWR